uniref:Small ribosomal subunit protein uS4c n=1 Tax=Burmannia oblonga TaxID=396658 RepID=A0A2H4EC46_9LILI|nr:ribosomal protein S4 [Burmannia oblonga]ANK36312.1 ribosomal protein S4 [Burmannia oblonga]
MSRYLGPRLKKIRRLGNLPGLYNKKKKIQNDIKNKFYSNKKSQYSIRLEEKQKLRFHYGLTERQLFRYMHIAVKTKGSTSQILLQLLEMRLDNILFRLGMSSTIPGARQLINHRHILVNGGMVDIPSYHCNTKDIISIIKKKKSKILIKNYIELFSYDKFSNNFTINPYQYKGLINKIINSKCIGLKISELLIVEYYSRQI